MRKRTRSFANRSGSAPGECVRVVPLHYPRPADAYAAPAHAKLIYGNGPLITKVKVFTIFWGKLWESSSESTNLMARLNTFFSDILVGPMIDQLAEYSVSGHAIGRGSFIGTQVITANAPVKSVTDSKIRTEVKKWIKGTMVPKNNENTLYFIYLDPGIVSIMGGSRSCQSYCGYHNNVGSIYYAVMPYPTCGGCLGDLQNFDAMTGTSSHELCEAITDPVPGSGWYDNVNGEIGDICAWSFKTVASYTVQLEWSNRQNKCL